MCICDRVLVVTSPIDERSLGRIGVIPWARGCEDEAHAVVQGPSGEIGFAHLERDGVDALSTCVGEAPLEQLSPDPALAAGGIYGDRVDVELIHD